MTWSALLLACGEAAAPAPSATPPSAAEPAPSADPSSVPSSSATTTTASAAAPGDPADCERVHACAEAFAAVAPADLAGPARVAMEQLDQSLAESPARAGACTAAIASFREDLERIDVEVPEACRASAPADVAR